MQTKRRVCLTASLLPLDGCAVLRKVLLAGCRTWRRVRVMLELLPQPLAHKLVGLNPGFVVLARQLRTLATMRRRARLDLLRSGNL